MTSKNHFDSRIKKKKKWIIKAKNKINIYFHMLFISWLYTFFFTYVSVPISTISYSQFANRTD